MIEIGKIQELKVKKLTKQGAIMAEVHGKGTEVIATKENLPKKYELGQVLPMFVYRGGDGSYLGTVKEPKGEVGDIVKLQVVDVAEIGTFLDLGIDRDIFLPHSETMRKLHVGEAVLVRLYVDRSGRLAASMKLKEALKGQSPYKKDDWVEGVIYSAHPRHGYFVAIDNSYDGLLPKREAKRIFEEGEEVKLRVTRVEADGKLVLSVHESDKVHLTHDARRLLNLLIEKGRLPVGDKSDPIQIMKLTGLSKSAFKRAAGNLYKAGEANIGDKWIGLKQKKR